VQEASFCTGDPNIACDIHAGHASLPCSTKTCIAKWACDVLSTVLPAHARFMFRAIVPGAYLGKCTRYDSSYARSTRLHRLALHIGETCAAAWPRRKFDRDAERLRNLPPVGILKAGIQEAMTDIHWLWQGLSAGQEASPNMRHAANTAMMGLIFMNSYAGRPGEWASLTRAKVEECLSSGQSFVAMDDHKTAVEYGTLGRHVSAGNAIAMGKLLDIHPAAYERFFAPTRGQSEKVVPSNLLLKFGTVYFPKFQAPTPTLMRYYFHDAVRDERNSEKAFEMLCSTDKHKVRTGKKE